MTESTPMSELVGMWQILVVVGLALVPLYVIFQNGPQPHAEYWLEQNRRLKAFLQKWILFGLAFLKHQLRDASSTQQRLAVLNQFGSFLNQAGIPHKLHDGFFSVRVLSNLWMLSQVHKRLYLDTDTSQVRSSRTRKNCGIHAPGTFQGQHDWEEAARFLKFATVIYGQDVIMAVETEICEALTTTTGLANANKTAALPRKEKNLRMSQLIREITPVLGKESDILVRNWDTGGSLDFIIHTVVLDHAHKQVIFALRGTLSLSDALVDLEANSIEFCGGHAHCGMAKMARATWNKAIETNFLEQVPPDYELIVCGHSLGAGVATLMTILLVHEKLIGERPIRCFAYAPPATFYPTSVIQHILPRISAFMYGNDLVPFFSVQSVLQMNSSLAAVRAARRDMTSWEVVKVLLGLSPPPLQLLQSVAEQENVTHSLSTAVPLTVAARLVVWFRRNNSSSRGFDVYEYEPKDLQGRPMVVCAGMVTDHTPGKYQRAFRALTSTTSVSPERNLFTRMLPRQLSSRLARLVGANEDDNDNEFEKEHFSIQEDEAPVQKLSTIAENRQLSTVEEEPVNEPIKSIMLSSSALMKRLPKGPSDVVGSVGRSVEGAMSSTLDVVDRFVVKPVENISEDTMAGASEAADCLIVKPAMGMIGTKFAGSD